MTKQKIEPLIGLEEYINKIGRDNMKKYTLHLGALESLVNKLNEIIEFINKQP